MSRIPETKEEVLRRYRCLIGHLICESLGYFLPSTAAVAVLYHLKKEADFCEWYYDWASKMMAREKERHGLERPIREVLLDVNTAAIQRAFRGRHHHTGYMASYENAKALVRHAIEHHQEPAFASWF